MTTPSQDQILRCTTQTLDHINRVREFLHAAIKELADRASVHDQSKLREPELPVFAANLDQLERTPYGTKEYDDLLERVKPAIEHHYSKNRHHPQFHKRGIDDMTLFDLVEMLADWSASSERNKNGNIRKSIEINGPKFNISEQLVRIFENTVKEWNIPPKG